MVEIKRVEISKPEASEEDRKYRLLYSKSKVYVNPTAYARDNIPGFVALVKRVRVFSANRTSFIVLPGVIQEAFNPVYLLAWIPESLLNEKGTQEWDKFIKVEEHATAASNEDDDGMSFLHSSDGLFAEDCLKDIVLIDLPIQRPESYAFSVPITSIYSLIVQPPTLSSWCTSASCLFFLNTDH